MPKLRFNGTWPVELPVYGNRRVEPGDVIEIPDDDMDGFQGEDWELADPPADAVPEGDNGDVADVPAAVPDVAVDDAGTVPASTVEG